MRIHDGAYGTLLEPQLLHRDETSDDLCVRTPAVVVAAHRAYLEAGATAIQTNSFLAHLRGSDRRRRELRHAALACAREAVGSGDALVLATIGPAGDAARAYWEPIEHALDGGVDGVLCETVTSGAEARAFAAAWQEVAAGVGGVEAMLGCSVSPAAGVGTWAWLRDLAGDLAGDVQLGVNCCDGPGGLRDVLEELVERRSTAWVMPSAGLPVSAAGAPATWPLQEPARWADAVRQLIDGLPLAAVGGCCGTTPGSIGALVE